MKQRSIRAFATIAAFMAAGWSATAGAAIFILDVRGVASGTDVQNLFGLGTTLSNVAFSERFTIDDAVPGARPYDAPGSTGIVTNYSQPAVTSVFTINGRSIAFGGAGSDTTTAFKTSGGGTVHYSAVDVDSTSMIGFVINSVAFTSNDPAFLASPDYRTPFSITIADGDGSGGLRYGFLDDLPNYFGPLVALDLIPRGATLAPAAAVPEPATWVSMIGGLGLVAAAMRRRRRIAFP